MRLFKRPTPVARPIQYNNTMKVMRGNMGIGNMSQDGDFGRSMGFLDFDKLWSDATRELQKGATQIITKETQKLVANITGTNGQTIQVPMTPEQMAQYQASGQVPAGLLPAGFLPQPSFFEQNKTLIIGSGVGAVALLLLTVVVTRKR